MREESRCSRQLVFVLSVAAAAAGVTAALVRQSSLVPDALTAPAPSRERQWHTPPDRWSRPRVTYRTLDARYQKRLKLRRKRPVPRIVPRKDHSVNGGYWFSVRSDPDQAGVRRISELTIYNERDYVLSLTAKDPRHVKANWVNGKVIYLEIWWGRRLGTYALIDVESESMIQAEMIEDGTIAFEQWRQQTSGVESTHRSLRTPVPPIGE